MQNKMRAIELFAGIGGFRLACDKLGIETIWANDISPKSSKVYKARFGADKFYEGDISDYMSDIPDHEILTGGFPCQPFSSAGKKLGVKDPRGTLFEKITEVIAQKKPQFFVLENVKRLLSMEKGQHFATILDVLSSLGYMIEWRLLNAKNFGLPQNRERIIIVGHKCKEVGSYLCSRDDLAELTKKQISAVSNVNKWKTIESHSATFHQWGLAFNGCFYHSNISKFSESLPSVKLNEILEKNPNKAFFFTDDTLMRIKS
ncbi:MAG: DNA (cytosine-5-)-methyltransferase [Methylococcaceae bacterium]